MQKPQQDEPDGRQGKYIILKSGMIETVCYNKHDNKKCNSM